MSNISASLVGNATGYTDLLHRMLTAQPEAAAEPTASEASRSDEG